MAITLVFFFLPASQSVYQSLIVQDAFGNSTQFVWFENFQDLFRNDEYLASFRVTAVFSTLVAVLGLSISLLLAVLADRVIRSAAIYKSLLIWPYAVAPAIAGVLWLFLFNPTLGIVAHWLQGLGIPWDPLLDGTHALIMVIIDTATSGGPGQATQILVYKVFADGFKGLDLGSSYAQSVVLMVIVITLTVLQFRYVERKVQY